MYTVVFVDGQPPANKDEIYEGHCRLFLSLSLLYYHKRNADHKKFN